MIGLPNLTSRKLLIAVHDALATALALFASLYLRFEGEAFLDRLPLLLVLAMAITALLALGVWLMVRKPREAGPARNAPL